MRKTHAVVLWCGGCVWASPLHSSGSGCAASCSRESRSPWKLPAERAGLTLAGQASPAESCQSEGSGKVMWSCLQGTYTLAEKNPYDHFTGDITFSLPPVCPCVSKGGLQVLPAPVPECFPNQSSPDGAAHITCNQGWKGYQISMFSFFCKIK